MCVPMAGSSKEISVSSSRLSSNLAWTKKVGLGEANFLRQRSNNEIVGSIMAAMDIGMEPRFCFQPVSISADSCKHVLVKDLEKSYELCNVTKVHISGGDLGGANLEYKCTVFSY